MINIKLNQMNTCNGITTKQTRCKRKPKQGNYCNTHISQSVNQMLPELWGEIIVYCDLKAMSNFCLVNKKLQTVSQQFQPKIIGTDNCFNKYGTSILWCSIVRYNIKKIRLMKENLDACHRLVLTPSQNVHNAIKATNTIYRAVVTKCLHDLRNMGDFWIGTLCNNNIYMELCQHLY